MSTSPARIEANRANAQHSTGPRTTEGKQRAALNALRHGLTGHTIVLPSEDLAAYQRHIQSFVDEYHPKTATEKQLVQSLSDTAWRLNRIPALENNLLTLGITENDHRVHTSHPEADAALAMALSLREHNRTFAALSMHGHRLSRQFERTLQQLREIQAARRETEEQQLRKAAELLQMHKNENLPYQPSEDGFVFSNAEIETFLRRRDGHDRALSASAQRSPELQTADQQPPLLMWSGSMTRE